MRLHELQIVFHLGRTASLPSRSSLSLAAFGPKPSPLWGLRSPSQPQSGSGQLCLTCEQAWPTNLQLKVELILHGVGHVGVEERRQA